MKYKMIHEINRISFHDAKLLNYELLDSNLILKFDSATIDNYKEENLGCLVLGFCQLKLNGIFKSNFINNKDENIPSLISIELFLKGLEEVLENSSENDFKFLMSGFVTLEKNYFWASWLFEFANFEFSWDSHVTVEDWRNGFTP